MEFRVTSGDLEDPRKWALGTCSGSWNTPAMCARSLRPRPKTRQLEGAIEEFVAHWSQDVSTLQQNLKLLTERLEHASTGYEQQEQGVLGGFVL